MKERKKDRQKERDIKQVIHKTPRKKSVKRKNER